MGKLGDKKPCRICGETAVLTAVPKRMESGGQDGGLVPVTRAHYSWVCLECSGEEPFSGHLVIIENK